MPSVTITAPKMQIARFTIQGSAPLMTQRFANKAEIMRAQSEEKQPGKRRVLEPKQWEDLWHKAAYRSPDGWYGVNASAFRKASISACRLVNFKMTLAKLSIFVEADGFDAEEGVPLVKITSGDPEASYMNVRLPTGVMDIRARPMWRAGWEMQPRIRWDAEQFKLEDITNLFARVGLQVGVGEGRPDSKDSAGIGYGLFEIVKIEQIG